MGKDRILVVEDDDKISKLVSYNLEKNGYECFVSADSKEAFEILDKEDVDLIILDVMLPEKDGFEICREIKRDDELVHIPIIMLTARGEEVDRVLGFELGAEDYVVKPFSPRELLLRVKAILKRRKPQEESKNIIEIDILKIDIPRHKVYVKNKAVELTAMEFNLLVTLIKRKGRVQSRDRLLSDVWDIDADVTTRTVDTHVKCLRKKLNEAGHLIETVRGVGYRFSEGED